MNGPITFATPLHLPCGARIENRFFKSAMSEQLGDGAHAPKPGLARLYRTWADGGVGLQVTGNVMVDRTARGAGMRRTDDASSSRCTRRSAPPWGRIFLSGSS